MPISLEHLAVQHFEISFSVISVRQFRVFRQRSWHIGHTYCEMTSRNLRLRYFRHFVGIILAQCVELMGEDLPCYSNKI